MCLSSRSRLLKGSPNYALHNLGCLSEGREHPRRGKECASPPWGPQIMLCIIWGTYPHSTRVAFAAMNEARTFTTFFSYPELGIRQVRTPGPAEK